MNTEFRYLYRDDAGNEIPNACVVEGSISPQQLKILRDCMEPDERFIPAQVEMPEKRFPEWTPDDTCWFTFISAKPTKKPASIVQTVQGLLAKFYKARKHWDENLYTAIAMEGARSY